MRLLKTKITSVYIILVLIIALIGTASAINFHRLGNSINGLMTNNYKSIKAATHMSEALDRQNVALMNYIYTGSRSSTNEFLKEQSLFYKWYETEANNLTEKDEATVVKQLNQAYMNYQSYFSDLRKIRDDKGSSAAFQYYYQTITSQVNSLRSMLQKITAMNEVAMTDSKTRVTASAVNSMYVISVISVLAILSGLFIASLLTNRFLAPLYLLKKNMELVSEGNIKQEVPIETNDEIGALTLEFNRMSARLQLFEQSTKGKLLEEKNRSLAIVKSISDPLIVLDTEYRVLLLNKACEQFFETSEDHAVGKHFLEVIRHNDIFDHVVRISDSNEERHIPKIISVVSDGKSFYFDTTVTKFRSEKNTVIGLVVLFQNVTKLKKLEKVKTDFVSTISHELKTPLTSIVMGAGLLRSKGLGSLTEKQLEVLEAIEDDTNRLSALVNNVIQLSKVESENEVYQMEPCSLSGIVEGCMRTFSEIASIRQIRLDSEIPDDLPLILVDAEKITWVINNLISNSIKYTNAGDLVSVKAGLEEDMMRVVVEDTGAGIPDEYRERVFERFVKVNSVQADVNGTGLGLSIAKEIVTMHKGAIWCESKLDKGSRFIFTLPLATEPQLGDAE